MKKTHLATSIFLSIVIWITAVYGLFVPNTYSKETANWATQSQAQDWLDLVVAAPLLIISAIFAYKKSIAGRLVWLGTLWFVIYSFLIYSFMLHFNVMFLAYVVTLGISVYLTIFGLVGADFLAIKKSFTENWSRKTSAILLIVLGIIFYLVWFKDIATSLSLGTIPKSIEEAGLVTNAVYVIDIALYLPALILSGYYLLKKRAEGYVLAGASLVFSAIMMANIAFIIYFVGFKGMPTDYSIAYVFGFLCLITTLVSVRFLRSYQTLAK